MALLIRSFVRDPHRIRNLVLAILMPLWLGINLYGMISIAWVHPSFLELLHGMLIWLILADFLFRLFVQKLSLPTLEPLLFYMVLHANMPEKAFLIFILLAAVPLLFISLLLNGFAKILTWRKYTLYHHFMFDI
jgi:hypothetical protein